MADSPLMPTPPTDVPARRRVYAVLRPPLTGLVWLLTGLRVEGRAHVPQSGPLLVVSNHLNNADPVLMNVVLPRPVHYLAKVELFRVPVVAQIIKAAGAFPIDRGAADRAAIKAALDELAAGHVVGVFPEGTRSRSGAMARGLTGIGLLALRSGAPVLPVAITGSERLLTPWPRPGLTVRIGRPFRVERAAGERLDHQAVVDRIMGEVAALLPSAYRGVYADPAALAAQDGPAGAGRRAGVPVGQEGGHAPGDSNDQ